jgi:hypothetical protein
MFGQPGEKLAPVLVCSWVADHLAFCNLFSSPPLGRAASMRATLGAVHNITS